MSDFYDPYTSTPAETQAWGKTHNPWDGRGVDFLNLVDAKRPHFPKSILPAVDLVDVVLDTEERDLDDLAKKIGVEFSEPA